MLEITAHIKANANKPLQVGYKHTGQQRVHGDKCSLVSSSPTAERPQFNIDVSRLSNAKKSGQTAQCPRAEYSHHVPPLPTVLACLIAYYSGISAVLLSAVVLSVGRPAVSQVGRFSAPQDEEGRRVGGGGMGGGGDTSICLINSLAQNSFKNHQGDLHSSFLKYLRLILFCSL